MIVRPPTAPERRLLPEGRFAGPMPWVIAIMMFLTVLAAAGGLGLAHAARGLTARLAGGITIQIVDANPEIARFYGDLRQRFDLRPSS